MSQLAKLKNFTDSLRKRADLMPALFLGHGSPMNAIEQNSFTQTWTKMGEDIPEPSAVLVISAHWLTRGTGVTAMQSPKTIHDFGGFPKELFDVQYPAPGSPEIAQDIQLLIEGTQVGLDHDWGLDHGTWSVVKHMYPGANIPVLQLSIDYPQSAKYHYELGKELYELRKRGVLIIGSGNIIHNLQMVAFDKLNVPNYGYDWAHEMNEVFNQKILNKEHDALINYQNLGPGARLAIPTPDHYYPLIYALALQGDKEEVALFNNQLVGGSLNMTSVAYGL